MKTITLFFFMVFGMNLTVNAQITKGNWLVGGDAFYNATQLKYPGDEENEAYNDRFNEIRINPNVGYFFIDKLAGGLQANISFTNTTPGENIAGNKGRSYGFSPFLRFYFLKEEKPINIFAQVNYSFRLGEKFEEDNFIDWSGYGLQVGTVIFFNQSVGLELSLKYTSITRQSNEFQVNNLLVGLGFQIHLDKK